MFLLSERTYRTIKKMPFLTKAITIAASVLCILLTMAFFVTPALDPAISGAKMMVSFLVCGTVAKGLISLYQKRYRIR